VECDEGFDSPPEKKIFLKYVFWCIMSGINRTSASFLGTSSGESGADMFTSVIFLHLPNTLTPQFWDHTPNCQCSITAHKAVCNGL